MYNPVRRSRPLGQAIAQEQLPQVILGGPTPIIFVSISQQGQPRSAATTAAQTSTPESPLAPFDLGKYQFTIGATTILHGASSSAAENDAPVSTRFVLLEIAGLGRPGREQQWPGPKTYDLRVPTFVTGIASFQDGYLISGGFLGSSHSWRLIRCHLPKLRTWLELVGSSERLPRSQRRPLRGNECLRLD
jgi:hypothetical protein